jgi:nucleoside-diphosphate-sugar epimerase
MVNSIVIGGAGFLGSHLVDALTRCGESVVVIDNLTTGRLSNLESAITLGRTAFVYADVWALADSLREIISSTGMKKVDFIYHFVSTTCHDVVGTRHWDLSGATDPAMNALIDIALGYKARLILSSPQVPGGGEHEAEAAIGAAVRERGLDARIVRFSNCYGPRAQNGDPVIAALLEAALHRRPMPIEGNGQQTRSVTYVADAIARVLTVARHSPAVLQPVEIISNDERTVTEIARALALSVGLDFKVQYVSSSVEVPRRQGSGLPSVTRRPSPQTSLERGLRNTYDWLLNQSQLFV